MSKSYSTLISNKSSTAFPYQNKFVKPKKSINDLAIEECKKLYSKNCAKLNPYVINQLKKDKLNIYLNNLKTKDLTIISKLLTKYFYFKHIEISPFDPEKEDCTKKRKNRLKEIPSTAKEFSKINKPKNALEKEKNQNIYKIIMGISRYLTLSDNIISLSLNSILISKDSAKYLAQGLLDNKTIQGLNINYCIISLEAYELFLKSLLKHEIIEYLDLSNNNFNDKYGEMIALIISSQTQRRDQIIWASGLRNDLPLINEYSRGLVSINLRGNKLGKYSAECISKSLSHDQYIRIIDLSENNLDNPSCKKFIHMMRKNNILLTVDLRDNPGYDESIYQRMIMKMSKNIRFLYQQFQNGNYTEEEFENLKDFIDISFFDVDIPQEIVDYYNGNIQDTLEENGEENQMQNNNNKMQIGDMNVMNDIQERAEEEEDEGTIKTIQEQGSNKKTDEENKKLIEENMQLKQQILELKSQKNELENKNNKIKKNNKIITKPDDPNNIEENYSYIIDLINELNEVMNNIENIKKKKEKNIKNSKKIENIEKNKEDNYINNNEEYNEQENNQNIIIDNKNNLENGNYNNQNQNYQQMNNILPQIQNEQQINEEQNQKEYENEPEQAQEQEQEQEQEPAPEPEQEQEHEHEHEQEKEQINIQNKEYENNENIDNIQKIKNNIYQDDHEHEQEQEHEHEHEQEMENNNLENNQNYMNNEEENKNEENGENGEENMEGEEGMEEGENDDEEINLDDLTEEDKMALLQHQEMLQKLQEEAEARGEHFDIQEYLAMLERQANEEEEEGEEGGDNKISEKINKSF